MFPNLLKKHQSLILGLGIFFLMMLAASIFSFNTFGSSHQAIYALSTWLSQHPSLVLLWHIFLISAIYWGWGAKVDLSVKRAQTGEISLERLEKLKKLKSLRWMLIGVLLLMDCFIYL